MSRACGPWPCSWWCSSTRESRHCRVAISASMSSSSSRDSSSPAFCSAKGLHRAGRRSSPSTGDDADASSQPPRWSSSSLSSSRTNSLGIGAGDRTATDGRWATVFLANFHFSSIGTNYLSAQQPPSPLQNYWSLSVEEQFYVVYPTFFLVLAAIRTRLSFRVRLAIGLVIVIGASLAFSVIDTQSNATGAYFSPFTRAWELALGALVAVGTPWLKKLPSRVAAIATWLGFGAILVAAFTFTTQTAYPGSLIAIPVVGAALIIAAGVKAAPLGAEALLGRAPLRGLGKLSYSLYLWHWPILIVAAEHAGKTSLSVHDNLGWDLLALLASAVTYVVVENPVRHARTLFRIRWASVGLGAVLVAVALGAVTLQTDVASGSGVGVEGASTPSEGAGLATVLHLVAASNEIRRIPPRLNPPVAQAIATSRSNLGFPPLSRGCEPSYSQSTVPTCLFGDRHGTHTMVLYGDSHAGMWFRAIDDIATRAHWRLILLFKPTCLAGSLLVKPPSGVGTSGDWVACDRWHRFAIRRIKQIKPDLVIVSQASSYLTPVGTSYTPAQWQSGLQHTLGAITSAHTTAIVLGDIPASRGPDCLAEHGDEVQSCSPSPFSSHTAYDRAERLAAQALSARYINVTPWFCARRCSPIIGDYNVYFDASHVAVGYSRFLEKVLAEKIDLGGWCESGDSCVETARQASGDERHGSGESAVPGCERSQRRQRWLRVVEAAHDSALGPLSRPPPSIPRSWNELRARRGAPGWCQRPGVGSRRRPSACRARGPGAHRACAA